MPVGKFALAISDLAIKDIDGIILYTAEIWGEEKAAEYIEEIYRAIDALRTYPELGEKREDALPGQRSIPANSHVIHYEVHEHEIHILRVLHQRANV